MKFRKVVSLFAAAALAVSSFAGLGISASAASLGYAEWALTGSYSSDSPAGTDGTLPNSSTAATVMNLSASSDGLTAPALYYSRTTAAQRANASSSYKGDTATITSYSGTSITAAKGFKCSGNTGYGYTFVLDPKLADNNAASYDLTIAFWGNSGETILKVVETSEAKFGQVSSGTAVGTATSTGNTNLVEYTIENLTQYASFAFSAQPGFAYAGIEYNAATTEPSIKLNSNAETIVVGNTVDITATTANADGVEVNWTSSDDGIASVENGTVKGVSAGTATITAMINVDGTEYSASCEVTVVNTGTVSFTATGAEGSAPEAITANKGESITIPLNRTLYVDGSTLTGWSDGTTTYAPGDSYTVNGDATLTAVFEENTVALGDAEATVEFNLRRDQGAPIFNSQGGSTILVGQATINGTAIDVKMDVDTSNGKFNNASNEQWTQVNTGTIMTVPVVTGSVVTVGDIYNDSTADAYSINGVSKTGDNGSETITEVPESGTVDIVDNGGGYYRGITVTYPQVVTEEPEATTDPSTEAVTLKFPYTSISNGNVCTDSATYLFVDGVDSDIASFFADSSDSTKVDSTLTAGYKNYIVGTNTSYDSPYITADLPAGTYTVYYLGYNHGNEVNATIASTGATVSDATGGVQFAYQSDNTSRILKLYTMEFTLSTAVTGETITFDSSVDSWLPDMYAAVITNQSAAPEATPTPIPDATDVMPDFAYTFGTNTNSTELTSTSSGTYYLDKDGKLCDSASYQTVTLTNVRYHNSHGLYSNSGATYKFRAQAPFKVTVGTCTFDDGSGKLLVKDLSGNTLYESDTVTFNDACYISSTDNVVEFSYTGTEVVDVTFSTPSGCYFPYIAKTSIDTDTISGALTGADGLNEGTLTFTSQTTGNVYAGTISNGTYSVVVPTGDTYDVLLTDCNYVAVTTYTANGDNSSANITCSAAAYQSVSGSIVNPPSSDFILTFTKTDGTTSTATVAGGSTTYVTSLMPGTYTVSSSTGTLSTLSAENFQVVASAVTKNLYYPETIPTATSSTVTVYPEVAVSGTNYHTIADAVAGIKAAGLSNSTIVLKSGATYQEQVRIQIDGVTLKTDGDAKATITWYYAIGYTYYSLGADGYYDKDRAMTKVGKLERDPDRWGAVVRVQGDNFTAENIIFENSFNQRFTEAEVADGVIYNGCQAITVDRVNPTVAADSRTATERAAAIAIEGTGVELYNCEFIGSQDTFFTGGSAYVKDCAITGNTDYIFGGGSIVFDNCDLIWGGYSDQAVGGYITASNGSEAGYLFRDCTIKDGNRLKAAGSFGRDWGGTNAHAYFINCTDATEKGVSGWSNMGGAVSAGTADLHVFDLSDPVSYATYGSSDKYNITAFTFADAAAKYEGAFDTLGFTPAQGINAETTTEALDGVADENDYVYGVLTEITAGSGISVTGVCWTVKDGDGNTYNFSTNDEVDGENMLSKGTFPTITGGTATVSMLFHAPQGDYEVASQAE